MNDYRLLETWWGTIPLSEDYPKHVRPKYCIREYVAESFDDVPTPKARVAYALDAIRRQTETQKTHPDFAGIQQILQRKVNRNGLLGRLGVKHWVAAEREHDTPVEYSILEQHICRDNFVKTHSSDWDEAVASQN